MNDFTFYHITDLHLYNTEGIGSYGKFFDAHCKIDQKCVAESVAIIDAAFEKLAEDKDTEYIIISGDLTCDGEYESHAMLLEKLKALKESGKKIYVTFATHDHCMEAKRYTDEGEEILATYHRDTVRQMYNEYGWSDATSEHIPSYSYAFSPQEDIKILMLNDDGDGKEYCGFYEDLMEWIENECKDAKEKGQRILAVTHHPAIPPALVVPVISHRDMLGNYETHTPRLADMGIEFIFTGHTHMQAIDYLDTEKGNRIYHINTGSVVGYPMPYRKINVGQYGIDVKTLYLDDFEWDKGGKTTEEYMKDHFSFMLRDMFDTMENDIEQFKEYAIGFSMERETVDKLKPVIRILGKIINNITFKDVGRLLLISPKVDKSVEDRKVKDFILEVITGVFTGIINYGPKTAEHKACRALAKRLSPVIKFKDFYGNPIALEAIMEDLLYNTGDYDSADAFLPY